MSDDVVHRLSVEGVDPLALAGVNDANLLELARRLGVRVSLRDVIAFPKTTAARALFEGAPTPARPEDLAALHIKVVPPHE